jgi:hypothetical protein
MKSLSYSNPNQAKKHVFGVSQTLALCVGHPGIGPRPLTLTVCCKLLKKFKNTNKLYIAAKQQVCIFPEGENPLYAGVTPYAKATGEVLASRKVVRGDPFTEGSGTAKSGTDSLSR